MNFAIDNKKCYFWKNYELIDLGLKDIQDY